MFEKVKTFCRNTRDKLKSRYEAKETQAKAILHSALDGTVAEAYIDTAVKILIAVVIGALLLTIIYAIFNETIREKLTTWVESLFDKGDELVGEL